MPTRQNSGKGLGGAIHVMPGAYALGDGLSFYENLTWNSNAAGTGYSPDEHANTNDVYGMIHGPFPSSSVVRSAQSLADFEVSSSTTFVPVAMASSRATGSVTSPVILIGGVSTAETSVGVPYEYTFVVRNVESSYKESVVMQCVLPEGCHFLNATLRDTHSSFGNSFSFEVADNTVRVNLGSVSEDRDWWGRIAIAVVCYEPGTYMASAQITYDGYDLLGPENTDESRAYVRGPGNFEVAKFAQLSIAAQGSLSAVDAGTPFDSTFTVTNDGPDEASGTILNGVFSGNTMIQSVNVSQGTVSHSGGGFQIYLGTLLKNATASVTVTAVPMEAGTVSTTATVKSSAVDLLELNNTAALETNVLAVHGPDLSGQWRRPVKSKTLSQGTMRKLTGQLIVSNEGEFESPKSNVHVYLSESTTDTVHAALLKTLRLPLLKVGKSKRLKVRAKTEEVVTGKYLLVVLDPDSMIAESNESNNVIVSERLD